MATELVLDVSVSLAWFLRETPERARLRGRSQRGCRRLQRSIMTAGRQRKSTV